MHSVQIVTDQKALESRCHEWRAGGRLAFDTEFIRDETYDAALCLIQVNAGDEVVLVDPVADIDVAPFWDLVCDPTVTTIVHAGKEDFEVCYRTTGRLPQNIFDIQIAAGFVGFGYPLSLSRLANVVLHKRLAKAQTLTDWLRRPLTEEQLRYAVEDVLYLPAIHEIITEKLQSSGRQTWVAEEFANFCDEECYRPPVQERLHKLRGTRSLDPLGLQVLEQLVRWRDQWAREKNRPIRAMMRDDILVEIARRRPRQASELEVLRGFPQARNPRIVKAILELIEAARATPRNELPEPIRQQEETPMGRATLDLLSGVMRSTCFEQGISPDLVGSSQRLRELMQHHAGEHAAPPLLLTGWRKDFIGTLLVSILEGRSEVKMTGWPSDPRLRIRTSSRAAKQ